MAHDAVVVGGGHNGLICGAYLARAGLDTIVLEARSEVGGCASTVSALGARVNVCNCDHLSIRGTPIVEELELERHGLRYLDVEPSQLSQLWEGGAPWFLFHDVERTLESLRLSYPEEVEGYRQYLAAALPVAKLVFELALDVPSRPRVVALASRHPGAAARAIAWSRTSVDAVLRSFFDTDALVAPGSLVGSVALGLGPSTPGTGLGALSLAVRHVYPMGRPMGGSGMLPEAVAAALRAAGGGLRTGARAEGIVCDRRAVVGVRLSNGEIVEARAVVVACDPRVAIVEWLREPPAGVRPFVDRWRAQPVEDGYQSKVDAVVFEPPLFEAVQEHASRLGVAEPLVPTMLLTPRTKGLDEAARAMADGRVAERPPALANVPSLLDPTMRSPDGDHVLSLEVLFTPYALRGGWSGSREPLRWLEALASLARPGFLDGVQEHRAVTPDTWEREFSLERGRARAYGGSPLALLVSREPELTRYETPVPGLFLTGAATFPGAGVWGAPGRNTAKVLLRKLGAAPRREP
jgi:phytoene dehydrogenase-like protein